ncbi:MAG TPA: S-layer homology domain-containing protein [Pseudobacteroides sp.]|nr:S-layer homology domain-containing protein [Pseudobacteroides sp.]
MKRKISILLSLIMVLSALFYVNAFAGTDKDLENAVKLVKSKIDIPADYKVFNFRNGTEVNKKVWSMDWSTKEGDSVIGVTVDEKGNFISYYNSKPIFVQGTRKLPKLSKQDAKAKADAFVRKVASEYFSNVKYLENNRNNLMDNTYSFSYTRIVNGIVFPGNYINVSVNSDTGEVTSYNAVWSDDGVFPSADKLISKDEAQKAYIDKLGIELYYNLITEDGKNKVYPVYSPKVPLSYIDAITGEKVDILLDNTPYYGGLEVSFTSAGGFKQNIAMDQISLTPEEEKAIESVSKVISKEAAEKKLRFIKVLGITDEFKLTEASIGKDYRDNETLIWRMNFVKEAKDKNYQEYVNVSIDGNTGELRDFWTYSPNRDDDKAKYDRETAKAAAEKFLKEILPDKLKSFEFYDQDNRNEKIALLEGDQIDFNFNYVRKVNDVKFPSNYISVRFDAVIGKVVSFNMTWDNVEFPSLDNVMPIDKIYTKLFSDVGLKLQYKETYPQEYLMKFPELGNDEYEIKLVYALDYNKPSTFDANTGELLGYDGKPYKEPNQYEYNDIKGHYAEKYIKILADYGIAFDESEFKPDSKIKQKDFMKLLSAIINFGYGVNMLSQKDDKQIEEIYKFMIREGIVKESEKAPDSEVTREDSVKFLIRMLKYDKVADLKGIYNCNYKDKDEIDENLIGYIVIADGLNIVKGSNGYFYPKKSLTRAEAIVLAYNYLQN